MWKYYRGTNQLPPFEAYGIWFIMANQFDANTKVDSKYAGRNRLMMNDGNPLDSNHEAVLDVTPSEWYLPPFGTTLHADMQGQCCLKLHTPQTCGEFAFIRGEQYYRNSANTFLRRDFTATSTDGTNWTTAWNPLGPLYSYPGPADEDITNVSFSITTRYPYNTGSSSSLSYREGIIASQKLASGSSQLVFISGSTQSSSGYINSIRYSTDGLTWSTATSNITVGGSTITNVYFCGIGYTGGIMAVKTNFTNYDVYMSYDGGTTWTAKARIATYPLTNLALNIPGTEVWLFNNNYYDLNPGSPTTVVSGTSTTSGLPNISDMNVGENTRRDVHLSGGFSLSLVAAKTGKKFYVVRLDSNGTKTELGTLDYAIDLTLPPQADATLNTQSADTQIFNVIGSTWVAIVGIHRYVSHDDGVTWGTKRTVPNTTRAWRRFSTSITPSYDMANYGGFRKPLVGLGNSTGAAMLFQ